MFPEIEFLIYFARSGPGIVRKIRKSFETMFEYFSSFQKVISVSECSSGTLKKNWIPSEIVIFLGFPLHPFSFYDNSMAGLAHLSTDPIRLMSPLISQKRLSSDTWLVLKPMWLGRYDTCSLVSSLSLCILILCHFRYVYILRCVQCWKAVSL